jgi:ribosome-associated toxin RatA of RatAB toxin-antitoxin module
VQAKQTAAAAAPSASASILIPYPPEAVWPVVSNPETLSSREPKVRSVRVLRRHGQGAVVAYDVSMSPMLPNFKYTLFFRPVAPYRRIEFHRLSGSFEHFDGSWTLHPEAQGQATRLTYALRVDPGFWAPAFLIQNAIQRDLPRMLTRVGQVVAEKAQAH